MFVPCFVVQCFVSFLVYNHLYEDERERRELVALLCLPVVL